MSTETWTRTYATASEDIPILFDSDDPNVELYIWQMNPASKKGGQHTLLNKDSLSRSRSWKAEYDMGRYLRHGEDSVYWFGVYKSGDQQIPLAESQYINVTIPESAQHHTITDSETITAVQETTTLQLPPQSTTQSSAANEMPSSQESKANKGSGLTTTEIIGAAVGASLGGVLILGGIWWLGCRISVRRETETPYGHGVQNHQLYQWELKDMYLPAPPRRIGGLLEAPRY